MLPLEIQAARAKLMKIREFTSAALWALIPVERPGIRTLAVDQYWRLYYDPAVVKLWSVDEITSTLYHELFHLLRDHITRAEVLGALPLPWNYSTDAEINDDISAEGLRLPIGAIYPKTFGLPEKRLAEEYYAVIVKQMNASQPGTSAQQGASSASQNSTPGGEGQADGQQASTDQPTTGNQCEKSESTAQDSIASSQTNQKSDGSSSSATGQSSDPADSSQSGDGDDASPSKARDASDQAHGDADDHSSSASSGNPSGASSAQGCPASQPPIGPVGSDSAMSASSAGRNQGTSPDVGVHTPAPASGRCGSCAHGHREPWEDPPPGTPGAAPGLTEVEAEIIRRHVAREIIRIAQSSQERGNIPGNWIRWAEEKFRPKVDWRRELASHVRRILATIAGSTDYTYRRPSRRYHGGRVILPAMHQPVPQIAVIVDTSQSIDDRMLAQAIAEVAGILKACGQQEAVHVLAVDEVVQTCRRVFRPEQVQLLGGGGTNMGAGIAAAEKLRPRPEVIIVITDCHTPWPAAKPSGRVVVVRTGNGQAPDWVKVIDIQEIKP